MIYIDEIMKDEKIRKALDFLKDHNEDTVKVQVQICSIPAPPFKEKARASDYKRRFIELGLSDVHIDKEGNVIGIRRGKRDGLKAMVCAHLDTVFPGGTDTRPKEKNGRIYAPGICDDCRGLAELLAVAEALNEAEISTVGDIIFCGDVGEEGLGDLRGVKYLMSEYKDIGAFVTLDCMGPERIIYLATGSHRYEVTFKGTGGHSFAKFGIPNCIHAMGRAITKISEIEVPEDPKTTFNVGVVSGGTSVNSIANEAKMLIDMRSNDENELKKLEKKVMDAIEEAKDEENRRWNLDDIRSEVKLIGDRPAAYQTSDSDIVKIACQATKALGMEPVLEHASSTDINYPLSMGIPSINLCCGGSGLGEHSLNEWFDPEDAYLGPQRVLLTLLMLSGAFH